MNATIWKRSWILLIKSFVNIVPVSGVDFINFLWAAFMFAQIQRAQKGTDDLTVFFTLLGSARVKAVCKMLVKSNPWWCMRKKLYALFKFVSLCMKERKRERECVWVGVFVFWPSRWCYFFVSSLIKIFLKSFNIFMGRKCFTDLGKLNFLKLVRL